MTHGIYRYTGHRRSVSTRYVPCTIPGREYDLSSGQFRNDHFYNWVIELDPDEDCGFRRGAAFDSAEVQQMLHDSTFTNCTVIRNGDKRYYIMPRVQRKSRLDAQGLVRIDAEVRAL